MGLTRIRAVSLFTHAVLRFIESLNWLYPFVLSRLSNRETGFHFRVETL